MTLNRIFEGVADNAATFQLINRSQSQMQTYEGAYYTNPHHNTVAAGQWFEIMHDEYWYFLECLPPLAMLGGAFAMSEFKAGNLTDAFFQIGERFYCMTIAVEGQFADEQEDNAPVSLQKAMRALAGVVQ